MIAPDCVVMRDGAAILDHRVERRALDRKPLPAEFARLAERMEGEVGGRAVWVDMGEAAGDLAGAPGCGLDRCFGGMLDRIVEILEAFPGDSSLEGVVDHAA